MIALIDYRAGNLTSVRKALAAAGAEVLSPAAPSDLRAAAGIIVPGVGHFGATTALDAEWRGAVLELVRQGRPLLGICLGMQWLYDGSAEAPDLEGLHLLGGRCVHLTDGAALQTGPASHRREEPFKVPHVGWNTLDDLRPGALLAGVPEGTYAYFTHSYAAPVTADTTATTTYGGAFAAVVERDGIFGVQFHPEKSGPPGVRLLRNFVALAGA